MWRLGEPSEQQLREFLRRQEGSSYSYEAVGASRGDGPSGYDQDDNRVCLGNGERVFENGCEALRRWTMFPAGWTRIFPPNAPIEAGRVVAMTCRVFELWWVNGCRIVYVLDEREPIRRFGFAYGTLPSHVERGEECFSVEQHADGSVWYRLRSFSRPRYWAARLARPLVRRLQRRFVRESLEAMRVAVGRAGVSDPAPAAS